MKIKHIFLYLLLAMPSFLLQSCLKDQEDIFDKPSSERMEEYLQAAQDTLVNAPYGWAMDYYPESNQSYGGFAYTIQFTKDNATVRFENNPDDGTETSLYKMKEDDGPVLSFDTYNTFLHNYATPASGQYRGKEGDFEFVIDSIGSDVVKVHGKKSLNTMYLHKLTEPAADYMAKVVDMGDNFMLSEADLQIGGTPYELAFTDLSNRQVDIYANGQYVTSTAYNFTDKGIRLYQAQTLNGVTVRDINYDDDNLTMSADKVTSDKLWVSPEVVANLIGNIGAGKDAKTVTKTVSHLDQLQISCDASWVHITTNGNKLTITIDANPDASKVRKTHITFTNGNYSSQISVTQIELSAMLGTYDLTMKAYNSDKEGIATVKTQATLAYETDDQGQQQLYLSVTNNGLTYKIPATYLKSAQAILLQSGQLVAELQGSSSVYYIADAFEFGGGYWTSTKNNFFDMLSFDADENGNITTTLNGQMLYTPDGQSLEATGYTVTTMYMYAYSAYPFTSAGALGWSDQFSKSIMVKTASSTAKVTVPAGHEVSGPAYLQRDIKYTRRCRLDWSKYELKTQPSRLVIK